MKLLLRIFITIIILNNSAIAGNSNEVSAIIKEWAKKVNKKLPERIDADTVLQRTVARNGHLEFHFRLTRASKDDLDLDITKTNIRSKATNTVCNNELSFLLKNKVPIYYFYVDKNTDKAFNFVIKPSDCGY